MKKDSVPSFTLAVVRDSKIIWEDGFGFADTAQKIRATPRTAYYIASITKSNQFIQLSYWVKLSKL